MAIVLQVQRGLPRRKDRMSKVFLQKPSPIKFKGPTLRARFGSPLQAIRIVIRDISRGSPGSIKGKAREKGFRKKKPVQSFTNASLPQAPISPSRAREIHREVHHLVIGNELSKIKG